MVMLMLSVIFALLMFGFVWVWLLVVFSFNAWRSRRLFDRVLAPFLVSRGMVLPPIQGHVLLRHGRFGSPASSRLLPLGSLVILREGCASEVGKLAVYSGESGAFTGLGTDGRVVRVVGQGVQGPDGSADGGLWFAGRVCSVGGLACRPGTIPGGDAPLPEVGVGATAGDDLVVFRLDDVSVMVWRGPFRWWSRIRRERRVRALQAADVVESLDSGMGATGVRAGGLPRWRGRWPAWWRYEAFGYLSDKVTRVYWDRIEGRPVKAVMPYRVGEGKKFMQRLMIWIAVVLAAFLVVVQVRRWWGINQHARGEDIEMNGLFGLSMASTSVLVCVVGVLAAVLVWLWMCSWQFPAKLFVPASANEVQLAMDNFYYLMRIVVGSTFLFLLQVVSFSSGAVLLFIAVTGDYVTYPGWVTTESSRLILLGFAMANMLIPAFDLYYGYALLKITEHEQKRMAKKATA